MHEGKNLQEETIIIMSSLALLMATSTVPWSVLIVIDAKLLIYQPEVLIHFFIHQKCWLMSKSIIVYLIYV